MKKQQRRPRNHRLETAVRVCPWWPPLEAGEATPFVLVAGAAAWQARLPPQRRPHGGFPRHRGGGGLVAALAAAPVTAPAEPRCSRLAVASGGGDVTAATTARCREGHAAG